MIFIAFVVLLASVIVGWFKVKQTNKSGFIPAVCFMVVVTALELTLGLRTRGMDYIIIILVTLIVANAYQLLAWHPVTKPEPEHLRRIEERRKVRLAKM